MKHDIILLLSMYLLEAHFTNVRLDKCLEIKTVFYQVMQVFLFNSSQLKRNLKVVKYQWAISSTLKTSLV